jgi:hypothetical protein
MHARIRRIVVAVSCLIGVGLSTSAQGAFISSASLSGPGGTGFFDGNFLAAWVRPNATFTSMDYIDLTMQVDIAFSYIVQPDVGGIHNSTGVPWGGFRWDIISGPDATFPLQGAYFEPGGWSHDVLPTQVNFHGAPVPSGSSTTPIVVVDVTVPGTVILRMTPVGVPEPGSLALLSIGALVVGYGWARKRVRAA